MYDRILCKGIFSYVCTAKKRVTFIVTLSLTNSIQQKKVLFIVDNFHSVMGPFIYLIGLFERSV